MTYFYARVSTKEQNLARQLEVAKAYKNIDEIFCDKQSGKNFDRTEYQKLKGIVKSGDEVIIKELDRLGRNKEGLKEEIKWFKDHGVILRILNLPTTLMDFQGQEWIFDMINNILVEVMSAMAEQELEKIKKRRDEGIAAMPVINGKKVSSKTGNAVGRPVMEITDTIQKFLKKQKEGVLSVSECCRQLGISRQTWYNKVNEVG